MKQSLIIILLLITVIVSCKKNENIGPGNTRDDEPAGYSGRVKSDGYYTYGYDGRGRVKIMIASNGITKYFYSDSVVTEVEYNLLNTITAINIYKLKSNNLAYLKQSSSHLQNLYSLFEYSATGALMKHTEVLLQNAGNLVHQYYRTGNRLDSVRWIYNNTTETRIYEYEPGKINSVTNESIGKSFLGVSSPNPVKRELIRINNNPPGVAVSYTYQFDTQNRIGRRVATRSNFPDEERVYTYY